MVLVAIKSFFKKKRIIKVRGKYIPQIRKKLTWYGLSQRDTNQWADRDSQLNYCSYNSLDEATIGMYDALTRIEKEKHRQKENTKVTIYEPEPEAWVKLKQK